MCPLQDPFHQNPTQRTSVQTVRGEGDKVAPSALCQPRGAAMSQVSKQGVLMLALFPLSGVGQGGGKQHNK